MIIVPNQGIVYNEQKAYKNEQEAKQKKLTRLEENRRNRQSGLKFSISSIFYRSNLRRLLTIPYLFIIFRFFQIDSFHPSIFYFSISFSRFIFMIFFVSHHLPHLFHLFFSIFHLPNHLDFSQSSLTIDITPLLFFLMS